MIALERRTWLRIAAVVIVGAVLAAMLAVAPSGLASAQPVSDTSPPLVLDVEIDDVAVLELKGAVAETRVFVRCAPGAAFRDLFVELTQRSGPSITTGIGFTDDFFCSGALETVDIDVVAQPGTRGFKPGDALAEANIFTFYRRIGSFSDSDTETIALRRRRR